MHVVRMFSDRTHMKKMAMHRKYLLYFLLLLLPLNGEAHASQTCVATVSDLGVMFGNQTFPLKWEETTMDDGKPLVY